MPMRPRVATEGWSRAAAFALVGFLTLSAMACRDAVSATPATESFERRDSVRLADDTFSILAKPVLASQGADGRIYIADASDKNIKVYDAAGRRVRDIGRAGEATDQFQQLTSAELAKDRVVAYSFLTGILTRFTTDGAFVSATELDPAPFDVRVVDDSLLLLVRHPGQGGALLALAPSDGRAQRRFFSPQLFEDYPELRFASNVMADARDGYVFVGTFGSDSLQVLDYTGAVRHAFRIPAALPLERIDELFRRNGSRLNRADSTSFIDGMHTVMGVVALDSGRVALQLATASARYGTNLMLEGDEIIVLDARAGAPPRVVQRLLRPGRMIGRDRDGRLLIVRPADRTGRDLVLLHTSIQ